MDLLNISRPWDCQVFPKSKTICYGGGGGGGGPVEEVVEVVSDTVSDNTPDIKVDPDDVSTLDEIIEEVDDRTPDIKIVPEDVTEVLPGTDDFESLTDLAEVVDHNISQVKDNVIDPTGDVVLTTLTEGPEAAYQGSDVDTTLETFQAMGELAIDIIDTAVSGEDKGKVKDIKQAGSDTQEAWEEVGEDYQEGLDNLQDAVTDTVTTSNEVINNSATNAANTVQAAADDVIDAFVDAGILTRTGSEVTEADRTQGGDVVRDEDLLQLGKKKSDLKAQKKRGKKGLRIDYGVSLPGSGKSGIAA